MIDPSIPATRRAREVLSCYENIRVNAVNKVFDDLDEQDFVRSNHRKLHLFSNILDVDAFDLAQFTHLFQKSFFGSNYFVCVGPYYYNNKRVDEFIAAQWKFSGDKHKSLQVDTERTFHQRYPLAML